MNSHKFSLADYRRLLRRKMDLYERIYGRRLYTSAEISCMRKVEAIRANWSLNVALCGHESALNWEEVK